MVASRLKDIGVCSYMFDPPGDDELWSGDPEELRHLGGHCRHAVRFADLEESSDGLVDAVADLPGAAGGEAAESVEVVVGLAKPVGADDVGGDGLDQRVGEGELNAVLGEPVRLEVGGEHDDRDAECGGVADAVVEAGSVQDGEYAAEALSPSAA